MIDLSELKMLQPAFAALASLLDFPDEALMADLPEVSARFPEIPEKAEIEECVKSLQSQELTALQEHYVGLFELNKRLTLYMTYYKLTDSRERGTVLAKLKLLYDMFGLALSQAELTDYLPAMLEFLSAASFALDVEEGKQSDIKNGSKIPGKSRNENDSMIPENFNNENDSKTPDQPISAPFEELSFLFSVLEDGTYELLNHAKEFSDEPYITLVRVTRQLLKKCIKNEEASNE